MSVKTRIFRSKSIPGNSRSRIFYTEAVANYKQWITFVEAFRSELFSSFPTHRETEIIIQLIENLLLLHFHSPPSTW